MGQKVSIPHSYSKNHPDRPGGNEESLFQSLIVILKTCCRVSLCLQAPQVSIPHSYSKNKVSKALGHNRPSFQSLIVILKTKEPEVWKSKDLKFQSLIVILKTCYWCIYQLRISVSIPHSYSKNSFSIAFNLSI